MEGTATRLICMSVEHRFDLVVERRIVEVLDLDGLEVFFGVEVALCNEEALPQYQFLF